MDLKKMQVSAPETEEKTFDYVGGHVKLKIKCVCLGSTIDLMIDYTEVIKHRACKAPKHIEALKFIWDSKEVPLKSKTQLREPVPLNLVL